MARKPRIHYPDAVYHVILRGNGGQDIFYSQEDRYRLSTLSTSSQITSRKFSLSPELLVSNRVKSGLFMFLFMLFFYEFPLGDLVVKHVYIDCFVIADVDRIDSIWC